MDDLRVSCDKWAELEAEETQMLRRMTVTESLHDAGVLYDAYAAQSSEDSVELREHEAAIGGLAVSVWAKPRTTLDVDLKILLHRDQAQRLLDLLPPDYTPLQDHPLQALQRHGVLFVKDGVGIRIDVQLADVSFDEAARVKRWMIAMC